MCNYWNGLTYQNMTKKHYEAIASIIKSTHNNARLYNQPQRIDTLGVTASRLADYFTTDNKNFNREMFLQACGTES